MAREPLAAGVASLVDRVKEGVGVVRERTIEIGARVLWVDNIGSLVILRGQANYGLAVLGGIILVVGLIMLQNDRGMAVLLIAAGVALIAINVNQKVDNGLSIGTADGRSTLIVSSDEQFLLDTLDLIRRKIETGSITLQGTFDIGATLVNSGGGGIVVGDDGFAGGAGAQIRASAAPVRQPEAQMRPPHVQAPAMREAPLPERIAETHWSEPEAAAAPSRRSLVLILFLVGVLAAAGGGGYFWWQDVQRQQAAEAAQLAWESVPKRDVSALRAYLAGDPGVYRDDAETALLTLERTAFAAARRDNTRFAYETFLANFPGSDRAAEARQRIDELQIVERFVQSAPAPLGPANGAQFNHYPRETLLSWAPLEGAATYIVEVQMYDTRNRSWVDSPEQTLSAVAAGESYVFNFVGAQPGRWRVRGVDPAGNQSAASAWSVFVYRR